MGKLGLNVVAGLSFALATVVIACASDPPEDFVPPGGRSSSSGSSTVPGGEGGASSSGGSSGGSSSGGSSSGGSSSGGNEAGVPADCTKMASVDDRPACDACTKQKCCAQLQACAGSPSCKAAQDCIAACASDDFLCVLTCSAGGGNGGQLLQDVGTCASQQCKTECPSSFELDGGFPF